MTLPLSMLMHPFPLIALGFLSAWASAPMPVLQPSNLANWLEDVSWLQVFSEPDYRPTPAIDAIARRYLNAITTLGFTENQQGIWLQAGNEVIFDHQGTTPLSAASLTKIATTLVALDEWGINHTFHTKVWATGAIQNGVLQGDLVIEGGGDPFMVWEEAIAIGNALNQLGITQVSGNLVIAGNFVMNYEPEPAAAGEYFLEAIDAAQWNYDVEEQFLIMPDGTPRPQVTVNGTIQVAATPPTNAYPLMERESLPLSQILKSMNIYSNNVMSEVMAETLGGATVVAERAAAIAMVPPNEIQLINGSGLGEENRVSPRASVAMLMAIQTYLVPFDLTVADILPVAGRDGGTVLYRDIPDFAAVKTGTLNEVSALAGAIPTRDRGLVWFALINRGWDLDSFRQQQDILLQGVVQTWNSVASAPPDLRPDNTPNPAELLGEPQRTQLLAAPVAATPPSSDPSAINPPSDVLNF